MNSQDNILKTNKAILRLTDEGIIQQEYPECIDITIEDSREELSVLQKFCIDRKRPLLVDIRNVRTVQQESRQFYSSDEVARYLSAVAFLVGNPVSKIMGNFFLVINKSELKVKLFTDEYQAIAWLKEYV